jgi:anti-anti-sigma factor
MDIATDGSTLVLSGSFDARSTWEVRNAIYDHLEGQDRDVVIDLSDVEFVDVTALRVLAVATRQASRNGHHLTLRGCNGAVRRLLHMTHLIRVVEVERVAATA